MITIDKLYQDNFFHIVLNILYLCSFISRWFIHFYVWGTIWNTCIFCHALIHCVLDTFLHLRVLDQVFRTVTGDYVINRCYGLTQYHFETLLVLFLITIQVSRRLYECFCVSVFSDSEMSIVHYCLGMYFYSSVGLTALLHLEAGRYI